MKKNIYKFGLLAFSALLLVLSGCRKEKNLVDQVDKMDFTGDLYAIQGQIDEWLYDNFTVPYNIRIEYKWDRSEVDLSKALTPIKEQNVIPIAQNILDYFMTPYKDEAGDYFVKRYPPKQYVFIGSPQYNSNGTVRTGAADAGRKIMLYRLNQINQNDGASVKRMMKTVHHEFAHILDHNKAVPVDFGLLAKADYVDDDWADYTDQEGWDLGFISNYARSQESDDFAETVAILLVYGQENFEDILSKAAPAGRAILEQKEQMVIDYFDLSWGINFASLQERIQNSYPDFKVVIPPFPNTIGDGTPNMGFEMNSTNSKRGEFEDFYHQLSNDAFAIDGRYLHHIQVFFNTSDKQIYVDISRYKEGKEGSTSHGRAFFDYSADDNGILTFTPAEGGRAIGESGAPEKTTSASSAAVVPSLIDWLSNGHFKFEWVDEGRLLGGLFETDENGNELDSYLYGYMDGDPDKVVPSLLPPFSDYFGYGLTYPDFEMNEDILEGEPLDFYKDLEDYAVENDDKYLAYIKVFHNPADQQIYFKINRYKEGKSGSSSYFRIFYDYTVDGDGILTFTPADGGTDLESGDAKTTSSSRKYFPGLTDWIENNQFIFGWEGRGMDKGGLYEVDADGNKSGKYIYGLLQ